MKRFSSLRLPELVPAREVLKKLILLKERLLTESRLDYLIIDTSPGIRTWSINALAISDVLLLTLKSGDIDSKGTKRLVDDIYSTFAKHGSRTFLLYNRVAGFCMPPKDFLKRGSSAKTSVDTPSVLGGEGLVQHKFNMAEPKLSVELGIKAISSIPCFCDIQFSEREFLTVLNYPDHPFAYYVNELIDGVHTT